MRFFSLLLTIAVGTLAYDASSPFDPEFSRNVMFPLTAAAYAPDPTACLATVSANAMLISSVLTRCDKLHDTCAAFAAELPDRNAVVISFRGTQGTEQLMVEAGDIIVQRPVKLEFGGKVGPYFKKSFDSVWNGGLESAMRTLASQNEGKELWITGHSLGGSMASIAAATIVEQKLWPADKIRLMTYGEPRTGDKKFAQAMDSNILAMHRVVHHRDMVVHIPPPLMGYKHSRQEIFYANDMSNITDFVACIGDEDKKCSNNYLFETSVPDHTHYYGVEIGDWGKEGCTGTTKMTHESSAAVRAMELEVQRLNAYEMLGRFRA